MYGAHFSDIIGPFDPENSRNLHRVDRRTFEPTLLTHVLDVHSPFGRFFLRNLWVTFFVLIVCSLFGLIVSNLVIILGRSGGVVNSDNIALHFSANIVFLCSQIVCFTLVDHFFQSNSSSLLLPLNAETTSLNQRDRENERVYRGYMILNICCQGFFMAYLILVQQELYWQAYWAIFIASILFMYPHLRVTCCMQELTEGPLAVEKFEKFKKYYYLYFGFAAFTGIVCLIVDTLVLANQHQQQQLQEE